MKRNFTNLPHDTSNSDWTFLDVAGDRLANAVYFDEEIYAKWLGEEDNKMAIIADVFTDPSSQMVLEVATGNPLEIYVIVQTHNGTLYLAKGGTYSYYEFLHPMNDRLTDAQWQDMLINNPPNRPDWISANLTIIDSNSKLPFCVFIIVNKREEDLLVGYSKKL